MEQVINQIYWESVANTYMYGTRLKVHADKSVEFENNMIKKINNIKNIAKKC